MSYQTSRDLGRATCSQSQISITALNSFATSSWLSRERRSHRFLHSGADSLCFPILATAMPVTEIPNALLHLIAMNVHSGTMGMRSQSALRMLIEIYSCQISHYRCEIAHELEEFFRKRRVGMFRTLTRSRPLGRHNS